MSRVTERDLYASLERFQGTVGDTWQYGLDMAYGGVKIVRYDPTGGQWDVSTGYGSKREALDFLEAMRTGIAELERPAPQPLRATCAVRGCRQSRRSDSHYCPAHLSLA